MRELEQQARYEAYERERQAEVLRRRRQAAELYAFRQQQLEQQRLEEEQARRQFYAQQQRRAAAAPNNADDFFYRRARSAAPSCSSARFPTDASPAYVRVPIAQAASPPAQRIRVQQRKVPSREQILKAVVLMQRCWRHKQSIAKRLAALNAIESQLAAHTSTFVFPTE